MSSPVPRSRHLIYQPKAAFQCRVSLPASVGKKQRLKPIPAILNEPALLLDRQRGRWLKVSVLDQCSSLSSLAQRSRRSASNS